MVKWPQFSEAIFLIFIQKIIPVEKVNTNILNYLFEILRLAI